MLREPEKTLLFEEMN
jgi:hypothetical protein